MARHPIDDEFLFTRPRRQSRMERSSNSVSVSHSCPSHFVLRGTYIKMDRLAAGWDQPTGRVWLRHASRLLHTSLNLNIAGRSLEQASTRGRYTDWSSFRRSNFSPCLPIAPSECVANLPPWAMQMVAECFLGYTELLYETKKAAHYDLLVHAYL